MFFGTCCPKGHVIDAADEGGDGPLAEGARRPHPIEGGDELVFIAPEEAEHDLQQAMLSTP